MRRIGSVLLTASLLVGCGPSPSEPSPEPVRQQGAPLTTTDVDVAPECQGILTFLNTASSATLGTYLPSNVVANLVARRATAPFVSLEDVLGVALVGDTRLAQLETGARAQGFITSSCVGIVDQLAVSTDDAAAIVSFVNTASDTLLYAVLPNAWNGATALLGTRPFTTVQAVANTYGIGAASLRNLRNAANIGYSLEMLANAVNATGDGLTAPRLVLNVDVENVVAGAYGTDRRTHADCYGYTQDDFPDLSPATFHPGTQPPSTVYSYVDGVVDDAASSGEVPSDVITDGMQDLQSRIAGRAFKSCTFHYEDGPWGGVVVSFFVDTVSGFRVMTRTHWWE